MQPFLLAIFQISKSYFANWPKMYYSILVLYIEATLSYIKTFTVNISLVVLNLEHFLSPYLL